MHYIYIYSTYSEVPSMLQHFSRTLGAAKDSGSNNSSWLVVCLGHTLLGWKPSLSPEKGLSIRSRQKEAIHHWLLGEPFIQTACMPDVHLQFRPANFSHACYLSKTLVHGLRPNERDPFPAWPVRVAPPPARERPPAHSAKASVASPRPRGAEVSVGSSFSASTTDSGCNHPNWGSWWRCSQTFRKRMSRLWFDTGDGKDTVKWSSLRSEISRSSPIWFSSGDLLWLGQPSAQLGPGTW